LISSPFSDYNRAPISKILKIITQKAIHIFYSSGRSNLYTRLENINRRATRKNVKITYSIIGAEFFISVRTDA